MFTFRRRTSQTRLTTPQRTGSWKPHLEALEDRLLLSTYPTVILGDHPNAYYRLGEASGATAVDLSGNSQTGTYLGGITLGQPGALAGDSDTSIGLNGVNGIVDTAFKPADRTFSIEAWIKPTATSANEWVIAGRSGAAQLIYNASDGTPQTYPGYAGISFFDGTRFDVTLSTTALPLNQWTHVVGAWNDSTKSLSLYVNGTLNQTQSFAGKSPVVGTALGTFQVGAFDESLHGGTYHAQYFQGGIDEVAYYSSALTSTQIQQHYKAGAEVPDIVPTSLTWDTAQGGVNFAYKVTGATLPKDATAMLYWASGTTTDTILEPATTPIPIPHTTPLDQIQTVHLAPADFPGGPAPGAKYLLAVVDPDNQIDEGATGEQNNAMPLLYDPKLTVTAKYDGDPTDSGMGRYFSGTDVLKDNYYTVTVSDSLDAFRPTIQVKVGNQALDAALSLAVADNFVTSASDPGSLPTGDVPLSGMALIQGNDVADFSATVLVEPLPDWVKALNSKISFDPNAAGPGGAGAYVFDGFLPDLSLSGNVFTVPRQVPLIGGQALKAEVGFEISTIAPLSISSSPTVEAGLQANLTLGDSISLPIFQFPLTAGQDGANWTLTVTPGSTLDPVTLNEVNGFSLTVAFDAKVPMPLKATLFDAAVFVFPFGIPTELEFKVTAALNVMLHAHAQIALDSTNGLEFLSSGTYLGVGLEGSLSATAQAGWFAPAWVRQLFDLSPGGHFKVPTFALRNIATVTLNADAEAHFGGPVRNLKRTGLVFSGTAVFSDKLDLILEIGDITVFDLEIADLTKKGPLFSWSIIIP
jgi:hypothetical protein